MADDYESLPDGNIRVPLPGGHWAEVRTVDGMKRADERAIYKAADADGVDFSEGFGFDSTGALQDAIIARMIRRWSLTDADGQPLPVTPEAVQDLPTPTHRPLKRATGPVLADLLSNLAESADPKSEPGSSTPPPGDG
jgi:hypothetical protein